MVLDAGVFALVAATMFAGTVGFVFAFDTGDQQERVYWIPPVVTTIAGVAYTVMWASASGLLGMDVITEARYIDWLLTTPLLVYYIGWIAGASASTRYRIMGADALMIVTGYVAETGAGTIKWVGFALSSVFFALVLYYLVSEISDAGEGRPPAVKSAFLNLRDITLFLWVLFPLVWLLGPAGFGLMGFTDYVLIYGLLDTGAKVGFEGIVGFRTESITTETRESTPVGA